MALHKKIINTNGVWMTYHKIRNLYLHNTDMPSITVEVDSYINEESRRQSEDNRIATHCFSFLVSSIEMDRKSALILAYERLVEKSLFQGASDC